MSAPHRLQVRVGGVTLKNPVIAAPAEHHIELQGLRSSALAGAGAVVLKSVNETEAARQQLARAEYAAFDSEWRRIPWTADAPLSTNIGCRSGLSPLEFPRWLEQAVTFDRFARQHDCLAVASIVLADIAPAVRMAKEIEDAGLRALEFNIGTPYARESKGAVATELLPENVAAHVRAMRAATALPLWVKISGQSERVTDLAKAAYDAGADAVVMAGRLIGLIPDVETMAPTLGTSLGFGGGWNLPLTCHWLASTRKAVGPGYPLIGINGAQSGLDIARMMLAGASAVGIASAVMLRGFGVLSEAIAELDAYLLRKGVSATDIIGKAADARKTFQDMPALDRNWKNYLPATASDDNEK